MNSKLYVRNLSYSITENELWTLFAQSGTVVFVDTIKDRATGRSKGFGFIQMSNGVARLISFDDILQGSDSFYANVEGSA